MSKHYTLKEFKDFLEEIPQATVFDYRKKDSSSKFSCLVKSTVKQNGVLLKSRAVKTIREVSPLFSGIVTLSFNGETLVVTDIETGKEREIDPRMIVSYPVDKESFFIVFDTRVMNKFRINEKTFTSESLLYVERERVVFFIKRKRLIAIVDVDV